MLLPRLHAEGPTRAESNTQLPAGSAALGLCMSTLAESGQCGCNCCICVLLLDHTPRLRENFAALDAVVAA